MADERIQNALSDPRAPGEPRREGTEGGELKHDERDRLRKAELLLNISRTLSAYEKLDDMLLIRWIVI